MLKKKGEPLYLNVTAFEKQWLIDMIRPRILAALSPSLLNRHGVADSTSAIEKRGAGELLLKSLKNAWDDHLLCMNMTTDVLMYMVSTLALGLGYPRKSLDYWAAVDLLELGTSILYRQSETFHL